MANWRTSAFRKLYGKLDSTTQAAVDEAFSQYKRDPALVRFAAKGREGGRLVFGAHVNEFWRALAFREGDDTYWFWVGSHSDYDRILSKLTK